FEGLLYVIVRSKLETDDPIANISAGRQHNDRDATPFTHFAAHGEAVHLRQHHVENHDIGRIAFQSLKTLVGIDGGSDVEVESAEISGEKRIEALIVINQEHACAPGTRHGLDVSIPRLTRVLSMMQRTKTTASKVHDHEHDDQGDDQDRQPLY